MEREWGRAAGRARGGSVNGWRLRVGCAVAALAWLAAATEAPRPASLLAPPGRVSKFPVATDFPQAWSAGAEAEIVRAERRATWQASTPYPDLPAAWHLVNRAAEVRAFVSASGIRVSPREEGPGGWDLRLDLLAWSRSATAAVLPPPVIQAEGAEILLDRGVVRERLRNEDRGLAYEIVIPSPPEPGELGPLRIHLRLGGTLSPVEAADGSLLTLRRPGGEAVFAIRSLAASDNAGRRLPARLAASARGGQREVVIEVDDGDAPYPLTIAMLASPPQWTAEGDQLAAFFSVALSPAGDVNGDGFGDVIAGSHVFDNGEADEGKAFLYLGSAGGLQSASAWTAEGNQPEAYFGVTAAAAGDVNGDGFDDVIVGAFGYDNGEVNEGRAYLYLGAAAGLSTNPVWNAEGGQAGALFGVVAAAAGDVNGDGFGDVIVGADLHDNGQVDEGRAYLFLGSATGLGSSPAWIGEGNQAGAQYGISVAAAGDVNADGYSDVIVGAVLYDNGHLDEGRAYVYHGGAGGLASTPAWIAEPDSLGAEFGFDVSGAGDVDGDGYSDVLVGAVLDDNGEGVIDEGKAFLYRGSASGLGTTPAWEANGGQPGAEFGVSVAAAGDVNGDGYGDVVIGASAFQNNLFSEGRVFVFQGSPAGLSAAPTWTADGGQYAARFGWSVAAIDVDGDGYGDVVAGAPYYDHGQIEEGRAILFRGGPSGPAMSPSWSVHGGQASASSAAALSFAGDVNGDGYEDVVIGAPGYDNGQVDEGRALLFLGGAAGLAPTPAWERDGGQVGAAFGSALAGAGDVNADGYADVIIGSPGFDQGFVDAGRAVLHLGGPTGLSATAAWSAAGDQPGARFGATVAWAGDLNADGFADLAIGAPARDDLATDAGATYVYYGSGTGPRSAPVTRLTGGQAGAAFGSALAPAFDTDADGFGDLLVGAPGFDNGQFDEGRAYLFRGSAGGLVTLPAWSVEGDQVQAACGAAVAGAGDVDGDGYADLLVGTRFLDLVSVDGGYAALYRGSPTGPGTVPDWTFLELQPDAQVGSSVARAGDVNGDGFADFLIAASSFDGYGVEAGEALLFLGSAAGPGPLPDWRVEGVQPYEYLAQAISGGGDVDADGYADLLIGVPGKQETALDEGEARLFLGNGVSGVPVLPRQRRAGSATPVLPQGSSDDLTAFRVEFVARSAQGPSPIRPEWEIKPAGVAFDGIGTVLAPAWIDSSAAGMLVSTSATGLDPDTAYHWRARVRSRNAGSALESRSRWLSPPWNASTEADLRTAAPGAGRLPGGGEVAGIPLHVSRLTSGDLLLIWSASCAAGDEDYEVYEGMLGAFGTHVPVACTTGGVRTLTFTPAPGRRYYLVVPANGYREGSYGVRSNGTPRPQGAAVCLPQKLAACP